MKLLEKLTPEQTALIPVVRREWLEIACDGTKITMSDVEDDIEWIYSLIKLKKPKIIISDSWVGQQIAINKMKQNKTMEFFWPYFGKAYYADYCAFADFFERIGIFKSETYTRFRNLIKKCWSIIPFESVCFVCTQQIDCKRDENDRLHSVTGPAVELDKFKLYFIHGVSFDEKMWKKIVGRNLSVEQLISIPNTDQRFVAMNHYGFENVIEKLEKKLIDKSEYGNELYEVFFDRTKLKMLIYPDIDQHQKTRISFVPEIIQTAKDAMAWKHNCTEKEYEQMEVLKSWL